MQRAFPISSKRYPLSTKANYFQQLRNKFPERANTDRSHIEQSSNYFQNNDNQNEIVRSRTPILSRTDQADAKSKTIRVEYQYQQTNFKFDNLLLPTCNQEMTFSKIDDFLADFLNGVSATIFAYGQTGAGKTYTIIGDEQKIQDRNKKGIIPRVLTQIIKAQHQIKKENFTKISISFFEVYNDKIFDLFSYKDEKKIYSSLQIKQDKEGCFSVPGLTQIPIMNERQAFAYLSLGLHKRSVGMTAFNNKSSRSHSIFSINYQKKSKRDGTYVNAKLRIVDLAGSEKFKIKNNISDQERDIRIMELTSINGSLSVLGQCISALAQSKRTHIPFRNSKLTRVLKSSLCGNSNIALFVNITSSMDSYRETISTLMFADRAKRAILDSRFLPKKVKSIRKIKSNSPNPLLSISTSSSSKHKKINQRDFSANNPSPSNIQKIGEPNNNQDMSIKTIIKAYCEQRQTRIELQRYIRENDQDHKKQLNNLKLQNQQLFKQLNQIKGEFSMFNPKKGGGGNFNTNKRNQIYHKKQQLKELHNSPQRAAYSPTIIRPIPLIRSNLNKKQTIKPKSILKSKHSSKYSNPIEEEHPVKHKSWLKRAIKNNNIGSDNKKPETIKQSGRSNSTSHNFAKIQNLQQLQPYYHPQKHINRSASKKDQVDQQYYYSSNHQINKPNDISSSSSSSYFINNQKNYPLNTLHQFLDQSNLINKSPTSPVDKHAVNKSLKTKNIYRMQEYELITSKYFNEKKDANKKSNQSKVLPKQKKVRFAEKIINQHELDQSMLQRMQHNQKYNDDTIFQHISIFKNIVNEDESQLQQQQQKLSSKSEQFKKTRSIQTQKQGMALKHKNQNLQIEEVDEQQQILHVSSSSIPSDQGKISALQQEQTVKRRVKPSFSYNPPPNNKIIDVVLHQIKDERIKSFWNIPPMTPKQELNSITAPSNPLQEKLNLNKFILPDDNHKNKNIQKNLKDDDVFKINSNNFTILKNNAQQGQFYTQFLEQQQTKQHSQNFLQPESSNNNNNRENSQTSQYLLSSIHEQCFDRRPENPLPHSQFSQDQKNIVDDDQKNKIFNFSDHQNDSGGSGQHPLKQEGSSSIFENSKNILLSDTGNGINQNNFLINLNSKNSEEVRDGGTTGAIGEQISLIAGSGCDAVSENGQHNTNNNTLTLGSISLEGGQIVNGMDQGFDAFINSDENSIIIPYSNEQNNSLILDNNEKGDLFFQ